MMIITLTEKLIFRSLARNCGNLFWPASVVPICTDLDSCRLTQNGQMWNNELCLILIFNAQTVCLYNYLMWTCTCSDSFTIAAAQAHNSGLLCWAVQRRLECPTTCRRHLPPSHTQQLMTDFPRAQSNRPVMTAEHHSRNQYQLHTWLRPCIAMRGDMLTRR